MFFKNKFPQTAETCFNHTGDDKPQAPSHSSRTVIPLRNHPLPIPSHLLRFLRGCSKREDRFGERTRNRWVDWAPQPLRNPQVSGRSRTTIGKLGSTEAKGWFRRLYGRCKSEGKRIQDAHNLPLRNLTGAERIYSRHTRSNPRYTLPALSAQVCLSCMRHSARPIPSHTSGWAIRCPIASAISRGE